MQGISRTTFIAVLTGMLLLLGSVQAQAHDTSILFIGNSFTYGYGAAGGGGR